MLGMRAGSRDGFEQLFERYRDAMWNFFRRRVPEAARAEELAQDVFLALLQGQTRYEPRNAFPSYLFGIAYRILMAERRRSRHHIEPLHIEPPGEAAPDPDAALWVRRALSQLDPDDREILMLREYEQLSYQEIADVCKTPLNTVRSRLFRARMALRTMLAPDELKDVGAGHGTHHRG
jgi:RNA polymerase sigma factor (sigma-70 family)